MRRLEKVVLLSNDQHLNNWALMLLCHLPGTSPPSKKQIGFVFSKLEDYKLILERCEGIQDAEQANREFWKP